MTVTLIGSALSCSICRDGITLVNGPEQREADERWFRARHSDEPHEPPSVAAQRRKR